MDLFTITHQIRRKCADLVTLTVEILSRNLHFLRSGRSDLTPPAQRVYLQYKSQDHNVAMVTDKKILKIHLTGQYGVSILSQSVNKHFCCRKKLGCLGEMQWVMSRGL